MSCVCKCLVLLLLESSLDGVLVLPALTLPVVASRLGFLVHSNLQSAKKEKSWLVCLLVLSLS